MNDNNNDTPKSTVIPFGRPISDSVYDKPEEKRPDSQWYEVAVRLGEEDIQPFKVKGMLGLAPYMLTVSNNDYSSELSVPMSNVVYCIAINDPEGETA